MRIFYGKKRVILERDKKKLVAILPIDLYEKLFEDEDIEIYSDRRIKEFEKELIEVTKDMIDCTHFYRNTSSCSQYGECPYRRLCLEPDNEKELIEAYYEQSPPR